jgi:hypothetical protein
VRDPEQGLITLAEFLALPDGNPYRLEGRETRTGNTRPPVLLFPLLVPVVIFGPRIPGAFTLLALAAGVTLFRFIVEE